jgi:hypothetical protein
LEILIVWSMQWKVAPWSTGHGIVNRPRCHLDSAKYKTCNRRGTAVHDCICLCEPP